VAKLAVAALGVVFGDIGTSPLYAMRECFHGAHGIAITRRACSACSRSSSGRWCDRRVKYVFFILRADNKGEGGILSLDGARRVRLRSKGCARRARVRCFRRGAALRRRRHHARRLRAERGRRPRNRAPSLEPFVVPITIAILCALFLIQKRGTRAWGDLRPITLLWFLTLAGLGVYRLSSNLGVLAAVNPHHGVSFLLAHGRSGCRSSAPCSWSSRAVKRSTPISATSAAARFSSAGSPSSSLR
jgi:KUP system potassium uptake protein